MLQNLYKDLMGMTIYISKNWLAYHENTRNNLNLISHDIVHQNEKECRYCNGWNILYSPKFILAKPNPQCESTGS